MEFSVSGTPVEVTGGTVFVVLVGLAFVTYGGYDYVQQSAAVDDAVTVEATMHETSVSQTDGSRSGIRYAALVEFSYQYRGTDYASDEMFPGSFSPLYDTRQEAQSVIASYDEGDTVTAYVDPSEPDAAFLERRTTQGPLQFVGIGGLLVLVTVLNAVGARKPGQGTELRPVSESEPTRYRTLFGVDRDAVNRLSNRLIAASAITIPVSLVGMVVLVLVSESGSDGGAPPQREVGLTDPVGFLLGAAFLAVLVLLASLLLYAVWSFTEYRRLRERIPEPRPPSPFKHPTRLVTVLLGNYDLDDYGKRVQRTGFALLVAVFVAGALVLLLSS